LAIKSLPPLNAIVFILSILCESFLQTQLLLIYL
jgi:hypothetical protein